MLKRKNILPFLILSFIFCAAFQAAYAESSEVVVVNWYYVVLAKVFAVFYPDMPMDFIMKKAHFWFPVFASSFSVLLLALAAYFSGFSRIKPETMTDEELLPPKKFGFIAFFELCWSIVTSTLESAIGEKEWPRFVNVLGGTFFVLLMANLSGVFPGLEPGTTSMSFTFAAAILIFIYFNYYGIKEAGFDYIKHMMGPIIWMAPLIFVIELASMLSRPVSLSLRIFGNVSGDHFVFSIFSGLMKSMHVPFVPIPAIFLGYGVFVAVLQAFIFMTLGAVYIKLALDSKAHP